MPGYANSILLKRIESKISKKQNKTKQKSRNHKFQVTFYRTIIMKRTDQRNLMMIVAFRFNLQSEFQYLLWAVTIIFFKLYILP